MKPTPRALPVLFLAGPIVLATFQATEVPTDVQLPGTQPGEVSELENPNKCSNCHGGYDLAVEPVHSWRGSMMAQATRDPLFWATMAVAEQDFTGAGDFCLRCHTTEGWMGGRSTPTDGSALKASDASGVMCDACHQMTDPSGLEHSGVQNPPFVANDGGAPPEGFYGSGMYVLSSDGNQKLGPYDDAASPHPSLKSSFHRSSNLCGTCHDVSNPVVGDLAPNNGAQVPLDPGTYSGVPGAPVDEKAAFNNFPFQFGIVERTFSEHQASLLSTTRVSDFPSLPEELRAGSILNAYEAATAATPSGDYVDGTPRFFTCQTCHMQPVQGKGCDKNNAPVRDDLPLHDLTGGNTWTPDAITWLDDNNGLVLGGGVSAEERAALEAGKLRARANLQSAASLEVQGDVVRVVNLTGHKLLTGFPEGRRMWLRVEWRDALGDVLRVDGEYGPLEVTLDGSPATVETLQELHPQDTRVWEAHLGISSEWAQELLALGVSADLPLKYDRQSGSVLKTLGELAAEPPGSVAESFHFVLNDTVVSDNRIPPYGLSYDQARTRNALPVPASLFGDPGAGGTYEHWDEVSLAPPVGAATATVELLYQATSWEYVQFLDLANNGAVTFLQDTGSDVLDAWLNTGMAAPEVMATASWAAPFVDCNGNGVDDAEDLAEGTSSDCDGNGVPDECQAPTASASVRTPCTAPAPPQSLVAVTDAPRLGQDYSVHVGDPTGSSGLTPGATVTRWLLSVAPAPGYPCGIPLAGLGPGGAATELLVSIVPPNPVLATAPVVWNGPGSPALHTVSLPCSPTLHGLTLYTQGLMSDFSAGSANVLTDALDLVLGL